MIELDLLPELSGIWRVFAAMLLVGLAVGISYWQSIDIEREMFVATARAFIQLIAIGYVLELIFAQDHPLWIVLMLLIMCIAAARTAVRRGQGIPNAGWITFISIGVGTIVTLSSLLALRIFTFDAQTMIPIGGMILGSSMTTAALTLNRLKTDFKADRHVVEEALALGAAQTQAARPIYKRAIHSAMIPTVDAARSVGLVKLPGAMTGLILAGVPPLQAVQIQMIVMYMLISAAAFTGLGCALLGYRQFFTEAEQLRPSVVFQE